MKRLKILFYLFVLIANPVLAVDVNGRVDWSQRINMSTPLSGIVAEIPVNVGDRVEKGAVLLRLQPDRFNAALSSANAVMKNESYKLKEAEREWARAQELYERTVLSDSDLQLAENLLFSAKASFANARTQQINAKRDVAESVIRAPFPAIILQRHVQPGETVVTRMNTVPMISLAASSQYHANGAVSPSYANKVAIGQTVTVTINNKTYDGVLASIGFEPIKGTDTYPITISFSAGDDLLRMGQAATIHLP